LILSNDNNAAFLTGLGKALKAQKGVDADLAEIISQNVLAVAPAEDCVEKAMTSITTLAAKRANPSKETANG
jgi:hypothetical protein